MTLFPLWWQVVVWFRLLQHYSDQRNVGVLIIIVIDMIKDMKIWLLLSIIFLVAFMVTFLAITDPMTPVELPIATEAPILFDIDFDPANPSNGFIVGNKGTFLLTKDGGKSWFAKSFANLDPDEDINYRFTKMSFLDNEGWIIGKPAILLHTKDSGVSWERVPLSPKLPGDPFGIVALGPDYGALYTDDDDLLAKVQDSASATGELWWRMPLAPEYAEQVRDQLSHISFLLPAPTPTFPSLLLNSPHFLSLISPSLTSMHRRSSRPLPTSPTSVLLAAVDRSRRRSS